MSQTPTPISSANPIDPKDEAGRAKANLSLIPLTAAHELANALQLGEKKYGAFNWRRRGSTLSMRTYLDAMLRHATSYADGEDTDPESGRCHLAHVMSNAAIILDAMARGTMVDDRACKAPDPEPEPPHPMQRYHDRYGHLVEPVGIGFLERLEDAISRAVDGHRRLVLRWFARDIALHDAPRFQMAAAEVAARSLKLICERQSYPSGEIVVMIYPPRCQQRGHATEEDRVEGRTL